MFRYGRFDRDDVCPPRYFPRHGADPIEGLMRDFPVTEREAVALLGTGEYWVAGRRGDYCR